jgi:4-oxalocrotonate tautomerase family enzyme
LQNVTNLGYAKPIGESESAFGSSIVPIIQCDIRQGRTDDQKRKLAVGLTAAVSEVTGQSVESIFLVIREMPGFNFVDAGEHVADYVPGPNGVDLAGSEQLRARGIKE